MLGSGAVEDESQTCEKRENIKKMKKKKRRSDERDALLYSVITRPRLIRHYTEIGTLYLNRYTGEFGEA